MAQNIGIINTFIAETTWVLLKQRMQGDIYAAHGTVGHAELRYP